MIKDEKIKQHVMIDLETLGLHSNAVILSVGAALFSLTGDIEALYHRRIRIESCLKAGLTVDGNTIEWWMGQKEEVKGKLFSTNAKDLATVIWELENAVNFAVKDYTVYAWSHGSNYDLALYENACRALNRTVWWNYKNVRDTRTLFALADYAYDSRTKEVQHDALDDAMTQARAVCEAYAKLKEGGIKNGKD